MKSGYLNEISEENSDKTHAENRPGPRDNRPDETGKILAMSFNDTTPSAQAVQLQIQRAMSGEQRLLLALEMSLFVRELRKQGIRGEHPEWSETEIAQELARLAFLPGPVPPQLR